MFKFKPTKEQRMAYTLFMMQEKRIIVHRINGWLATAVIKPCVIESTESGMVLGYHMQFLTGSPKRSDDFNPGETFRREKILTPNGMITPAHPSRRIEWVVKSGLRWVVNKYIREGRGLEPYTPDRLNRHISSKQDYVRVYTDYDVKDYYIGQLKQALPPGDFTDLLR